MNDSAPYSMLSQIYDRVMAHVNYKAWAGYVSSLFAFYPGKVKKVADIACGTGKHMGFLKKKDLLVVGLDLSLPMLAEARKSGHNLLAVSDSVALPLRAESQQAVLMLYDSINYLLEEQDIMILFSEVARVLAPRGIFIFDVVTREGVRQCFDNYYESDSWNGLAYERHGWFSQKDNLQYNDFYFLYHGESYKERHVQKIRNDAVWTELIAQSPLNMKAAFENLTHKDARKQSERIHFICAKPQ